MISEAEEEPGTLLRPTGSHQAGKRKRSSDGGETTCPSGSSTPDEPDHKSKPKMARGSLARGLNRRPSNGVPSNDFRDVVATVKLEDHCRSCGGLTRYCRRCLTRFCSYCESTQGPRVHTIGACKDVSRDASMRDTKAALDQRERGGELVYSRDVIIHCSAPPIHHGKALRKHPTAALAKEGVVATVKEGFVATVKEDVPAPAKEAVDARTQEGGGN